MYHISDFMSTNVPRFSQPFSPSCRQIEIHIQMNITCSCLGLILLKFSKMQKVYKFGEAMGLLRCAISTLHTCVCHQPVQLVLCGHMVFQCIGTGDIWYFMEFLCGHVVCIETGDDHRWSSPVY